MLKHVRICAAAAAVAAVLAVSGCSTDSGDDGNKDETPSASDNGEGTSGGSGESEAPGDGATGSIEGNWATVASGKPVALVVQGTRVAIAGEHVCSGTASEEGGSQTLKLSCKDGNTDRTQGVVTSVDDKTLKVKWEGAGEEAFSKADGKELPDGLPTEGLPKS
ncbi:hypothetical protein DSC45_25140 [Streptomyces sp. YIM 130001]|uniref:hypothetical protein n=1 Tax=Streptomyces sp. YIM 130001 TaxID=2259644 RepID=UPI000ED5FEAA|nr:hypothetical protein [Streptomyces sp. YIM 130001]RII12434.1 hypothetical protein DSC45_25140 [Streptomyces sp. YIM 130001]